MSDVRLDTVSGCCQELALCSEEVQRFAHDWALKAGELKERERRYARLEIAAMRGIEGRNADERKATAQVAVEQVAPGLAEEIEELIGKVEEYKTLFKTIDRRADNTRSLLSSHKEEAKTEGFGTRRAFHSGPRAA